MRLPLTMVDMLRYRAALHGDRLLYTWLDDDGQEVDNWTIADLDKRASAIARQLSALAITGDRALLIYPPGLAFAAAFFGCLYAGIIAVPTSMPHRRRPDHRLRAITADAEPKLLLTTTGFLSGKAKIIAHNPELAELTWLATDQIGLEPADDRALPTPAVEDIAYLQYTSGSTAIPKGVMVTHANLMVNQEMAASVYGMDTQAVCVSWLPAFHDLGLMGGVTISVYLPCRVIRMAPAAFIQKPVRWLAAISHYQGSFTAAPNFAYDLCVLGIKAEERAGLDLSSLVAAMNGAEPVRIDTLERFNTVYEPYGFRPEMFAPTYGLAEAIVYVSGAGGPAAPLSQYFNSQALARGRAEVVQQDALHARKLVACGAAGEGTGVLIVDPETFLPVDDGRVGEIWVTGPHVSPGYWNQPELTRQTFQAHLAEDRAGPFLRSGDLGFIYGGKLFVSGRIKEMIIIRGNNYFPQDIEHTIEMCHPALKPGGGAAFSIDTGKEELLVVAHEVRREARRKLDTGQIAGAVRRAIAGEYGLGLGGLLLVRPMSIPKTSSGKTRRLEVRQAFLEGTLAVLDQWLSTVLTGETEALVAGEAAPVPPFQLLDDPEANARQISRWIERRLTRLPGASGEAMDLTRSFSDYGLDSLLSVQLVNELARWLNLSLALADLWELPNIQALIEYLLMALSPAVGEGSAIINSQRPSRRVGREEAGQLLEKIDDLSESEIDALLAALDEDNLPADQ